MAQSITGKYDRSLGQLKAALRAQSNDDLIVREFLTLGQKSALLFIDGMVSAELVGRLALMPLERAQGALTGQKLYDAATQTLLGAIEISEETDIGKIAVAVMQGQTALLLDSVARAVILDLRQYVHRGVSTPRTESVVVGPHEAFTESLRDNLTMLHRMLQTPLLSVKSLDIGTEIPTQAAVAWMDGVAPQQSVDRVLKRLKDCRATHILPGGMLEQLLEDDPMAPLPQMVTTERPDRAASFLLEGQVVVLCDGAPQVMALPIDLLHLFHAPDDTAMRWQYGTFMRLIRLFGALMALVLPALFVALCMYHTGLLPMALLVTVMESESSLPLGILAECLVMLVLFNLINEAGQRVPGLMGSSLGLVSALILGSAAVDAQLVSPLLIIVVALGGLGSYAIPDYSVSMVFRIFQLALVLLAGLAGLTGVVLGLVALTCWVAGMRSLGSPFLAPLSPARACNPDLVLRAPIYRQRLNTYLSNPNTITRLRGRMRGGRK